MTAPVGSTLRLGEVLDESPHFLKIVFCVLHNSGRNRCGSVLQVGEGVEVERQVCESMAACTGGILHERLPRIGENFSQANFIV